MNGTHISRALAANPLTANFFKGVRAADDIPRSDTLGAFVVNTDPAHKPGQHWVVLINTPTSVTYFDPYGIPPPEIIRTRLVKTSKTLLYNRKRFQGLRNTCGYYCMYFILAETSQNHTMDIFSDCYDFNDRLVYIRVQTLFNLKQ